MKRLTVTALTIALLALPALASPAAAAPTCNGKKATIIGNDKANILRGTNKRDVIVAKGGRDTIYGNGGGDIICAGKGHDTVFAGAGWDKVFGQGGNDTLKGGPGYDVLNGGSKTDACYVNADGGKEVACEDADLRVTIKAPTEVIGRVGPDFFSIVVKTKNIGSKPLSDVVLEIVFEEMNAPCSGGDDLTGTYEYGTLVAGGWHEEEMTTDCGAPPASPSEITLSASATTTSAEPNKTNNVADIKIEVIDGS